MGNQGRDGRDGRDGLDGQDGQDGAIGSSGGTGATGSGGNIMISNSDKSTIYPSVDVLRFNEDSGFQISQPISNEVLVTLSSHFKNVTDDISDIVASGEDTLKLFGSTSVTLTYNTTEKSITFESTGGGSDTIGTPTDGNWDDGLLSDWVPETKLSDALDEINEILNELVPDNANTLQGTNLVGNQTLYTGRLAAGLDGSWYQQSKIAGSLVTRVISANNITLSSPSPSNTFNKGDKGLLRAKKDGGVIVTFDIGNNFDESRRNTSQIITNYTAQTGDPIDNGIASNSYAQLEVTSIIKYNKFQKWQKVNANIKFNLYGANIEGYTEFSLMHDLPVIQESNIYSFWRDPDNSSMIINPLPIIELNTIVSSKTLSGVSYYSLGDIFDVEYTIENCYKNIYQPSQIVSISMIGIGTINYDPPSTPPNLTDSFTQEQGSVDVTIDQPNVYSTNARLIVTGHHPIKNTVTANSAVENRLINTYTERSTATKEYFVDEDYRLNPAGIIADPTNYLPTMLSNGKLDGVDKWDSDSKLADGDAIFFNEQANSTSLFNFTTGYLPISTDRDYSIYTSTNPVFYRVFSDYGHGHNGVNLRLPGLTVQDITSATSPDLDRVIVEVKLPGNHIKNSTGWLDVGTLFPQPFNQFNDGEGCRVGMASTDTFEITFGTANTVGSGYMIVVRVTFNATSKYINSGMEVIWPS